MSPKRVGDSYKEIKSLKNVSNWLKDRNVCLRVLLSVPSFSGVKRIVLSATREGLQLFVRISVQNPIPRKKIV